MQNMPLVSVITPTYNRAHTIQQAVESLLGQTYRNWELIVIDDGSTDDTKKIIDDIDDDRIRYFYQENKGPTAARNTGIAHAKGYWVTYLDSDDVLFPACLETMLEWLTKNPKAVFGFPRADRHLDLYENGKLVKTVNDSGDTPENFTIHDIFMRNAGFACLGFMHLKRVFDEGIKWDENLSAMEDWEFMMSIGEKYPEGFVYVPVVLYTYHQRFGRDNMVSKATYQTWADAFKYIYKKHKDSKMLKGQTWYPQRVNKWEKLQKEFEAGKRPAYQYHYFNSL